MSPTAEEIRKMASPRAYVAGALFALARVGEALAACVNAELLEELAGGGAGLDPGAHGDERVAILEIARAARAFEDALRSARESGIL